MISAGQVREILNLLSVRADGFCMRRTWTLLPALVALLLAWPLLVQASREHTAGHGSSAVGQTGGAVTPTPFASAAAASASAVMSMVPPAPTTGAPTTSAAQKPKPVPKPKPKPVPKPKPRPAVTMSMVVTPSPPKASPTPARTTPARTTPARTTPARTTPAATTPAPTTAARSTSPAPTTPAPTTTKASPKPTHRPKPVVTSSAPPLTGGTVTIGNFQYATPSHVSPGARIAIYNADSVAHTVTIASAGIDVVVAGDSGGYLTAPSTPGSYVITCDYHADMTATLIVR